MMEGTDCRSEDVFQSGTVHVAPHNGGVESYGLGNEVLFGGED